MSGTATIAELAARIEELTLTVHRLERTVRCKVAAPVDRLTLEEAAVRLGRSTAGFEHVVRSGLFTDPRPADKRRGSKRLFLADEIDVYATDGERGVERLRADLGRD